MTQSIARTISGNGVDSQRPAKASVVIPTTLRDSLVQSVRSVYGQSLEGPVHVLIGIDKAEGDPAILDQLADELPQNHMLTIVDPGYSTSTRHGGLHPAHDGGVLRTVLSYLANSRHVAYLDDDNWWDADHLRSLLAAIDGKDWAFGLRWFVDPATREPLCVDEWESVGPDRGVFAKRAEGFVDPSSLMIDKIACESVLRWWTVPLSRDPVAMSADRNVFLALKRHFSFAATGKATCYYVIETAGPMYRYRAEWIKLKTGVDI